MSFIKNTPEYVFMYLTDCEECNRVNVDCVCGDGEPEEPVEPARFAQMPDTLIDVDMQNFQVR